MDEQRPRRFGRGSEFQRMLQATAVFLAALIAFVFVATLVLTGSDWGHERVRQFVLARMEGFVHGRVTIGRVRGNLLTGATIDAVAIADSAGQPFLAAQQVSANYSILQLITRHVNLRNVRLVRPLIFLDRPPDGKWNYQRIFPPADTTKPGYVRGKGIPYLVLHNVTLLDGHLVMRNPWHPDRTLSRAAQDSTIREALGGRTRLRVIPVSGGYEKVVELRNLTARAPLVRIVQPGFHDRLAQIATLQMEALPFRPPSAVVRDLNGLMRFNNDSVWWHDVAVRMPGSSLRGDGHYVFGTGDMRITAAARPAAFADFRFVYPQFPSSGGGPLDFRLNWKGTTQDYVVQNADVRTEGAHLVGRFAVSFADTFALHDTDVRFTDVGTKLVEQLAPGFVAPRRGSLDGHLVVMGGRNAMHVDGSLAYHDQGDGTSVMSGRGAIGYRHGELILSDLRLHAAPVQLVLVKALGRKEGQAQGSLAKYVSPIDGTLEGNVVLNGTTETQISIAGDVTHRDRGAVSQLTGRATMGVGRNDVVDVDLRAHPISLAEVGLFAPSIGLRGSASGPIRLRGTLGDMHVALALRTPDGGAMNVAGRVDLKGPTRSYDLAGGMQLFDLHSVLASAPVTSINATASARGTGFSLATINGAVNADFSTSSWNNVTIDRGTVRMSAANGLAHVDRLVLLANGTDVSAAGTFGLAANRSGTLRYSVTIDSLTRYRKWIPGTSDTGVVRPRPAIVNSAIARARAQQERVDRAMMVENAATGRPIPRVPVDTPSAIARGAVSGALYAAGTVTGNLTDFDLRGRLSAKELILAGNSAHSLRAEYAWTNARTKHSRLAVGVSGSALSVHGFAFDTIEGRLAYAAPTGQVQLAISQGDNRNYSARGSFVLGANRQVRLEDLALRMDTTTWRLSRVAVIDLRNGGLAVHDFEMQSNRGGLLYVNGTMSSSGGGSANLVIDVRNFQVADVTDLLQSDLALSGIVTARGVVQGSLRAPTFRGAAAIVNGNYNGSVIPNVRATFTYADALLVAHAEVLRAGRAAATIADARLPINLALTGVTGSRLLDRPMSVAVRGDSLPLDLIPGFTDAVAQIHGHAMGVFAMSGTLARPTLTGALTWVNGSVKIVPTGMVVNNITASVRMMHDTVFVDSVAGQSGGGPVRLTGRLYVGSWREPGFDLHVVANNAQVLNNDLGHLDADAGISLTGPFNDAYVAGAIVSRGGVIYIPESQHKNLVNAGDPALFSVMDTSVAYDRELFPVTSPLLQHLRVDVDVTVNRDTWVRSRDANIEVFTEEPVRVHREQEALALTGVVLTDRGEYSFLSKRFNIKRGSATFMGGPELNPTLQATGEYQVALVGRPDFNVRVLIGGTAQKPKLTLESDAQPPISQSDLLSYLAFGRSTSSLLQLEGSGLTGQTSTGNLVGVGAALAMKRMAAVALGVMTDEVEGEATKGLGADVFDITPADVPTELGAQNVIGFLQSTRIEAGKYITPNLFAAIQAQQYPGARLEYRTAKGWQFQTSIEPRYLLQPPKLALQPVAPVSSFGAFVIREWRW